MPSAAALLTVMTGGAKAPRSSDCQATVNLLTSTIKMDADDAAVRFCFRLVSPAKTYTLQVRPAEGRAGMRGGWQASGSWRGYLGSFRGERFERWRQSPGELEGELELRREGQGELEGERQGAGRGRIRGVHGR